MYADAPPLGQTLAEVFGVGRLASGISFLGQILVRGGEQNLRFLR
ncbi:hypothetical protein BH23ACI1_BH23ACI1_07230 [soil metagenome]